jgi:hypothetical protein
LLLNRNRLPQSSRAESAEQRGRQPAGKIGESLASVQKFDVPLEVTTTSLEALKAFSIGVKTAH